MKISIIDLFRNELEAEAKTTRKMLSIVPDDKYDWKPHEKSMAIRMLATHIAELPTWVAMVMNSTELDFAKNEYNPVVINNTAELMVYFEKCLEDGRAAIEKMTDENLSENWKLRNGDVIYSSTSRHEFIRTTYSQIVHHRAQLGVNLRLLNVAIPGSYGPSADDMSF